MCRGVCSHYTLCTLNRCRFLSFCFFVFAVAVVVVTVHCHCRTTTQNLYSTYIPSYFVTHKEQCHSYELSLIFVSIYSMQQPSSAIYFATYIVHLDSFIFFFFLLISKAFVVAGHKKKFNCSIVVIFDDRKEMF